MVYQRIRDLREDADLTQEKIAQILYIHRNVYRNYESGKREIPFQFAIALAKYYNVSLDYIAGFTHVKRPPLHD